MKELATKITKSADIYKGNYYMVALLKTKENVELKGVSQVFNIVQFYKPSLLYTSLGLYDINADLSNFDEALKMKCYKNGDEILNEWQSYFNDHRVDSIEKLTEIKAKEMSRHLGIIE